MSAPGAAPPVPTDPAAAAAAAAAMAAAIAEVKEVFGTSFIGFAVATTAYGIVLLQCYLYFRNYPKDSIRLKLTVGILWLFDTLSTIMVAHSLYTYFVLNFGDLAADAKIPWSFALENGCLTMTTITAQCYYSWQIWNISNGNVVVTGAIFLLALASCGLGLYVTVHLFREPTVATLSTSSFRAVSGPVQGTAGVCDIAIMLALIYYLRSKRRAGIRTTEEMIDTLILYAMCRGVLTAITQILFLGLNVGSPEHTYWQPFHQLVGKLYVNSILASLNVRRVVLGRGDPEHSYKDRSDSNSKSHSRATGSTGTMPLAFLSPKADTDVSGVTFDTEARESTQDQDQIEMETPKKPVGILPGT